MSSDGRNVALEQVIESEANAVAELLATPSRCVMVHVIVAQDDGTVFHGHGVAGETKGKHLAGFIEATKKKLGWLVGKSVKRG